VRKATTGGRSRNHSEQPHVGALGSRGRWLVGGQFPLGRVVAQALTGGKPRMLTPTR
jgi:hypothetical protein